MLERRLAEVEAAFAGAKVTLDVAAEASTEAKFNVPLAAGTLPDLVTTHTAIAHQPPQLTDLTPYLAKDKAIKATDYFPTAFEAHKVTVASATRQVGIPREEFATLCGAGAESGDRRRTAWDRAQISGHVHRRPGRPESHSQPCEHQPMSRTPRASAVPGGAGGRA